MIGAAASGVISFILLILIQNGSAYNAKVVKDFSTSRARVNTDKLPALGGSQKKDRADTLPKLPEKMDFSMNTPALGIEPGAVCNHAKILTPAVKAYGAYLVVTDILGRLTDRGSYRIIHFIPKLLW
jgi:hypothetical protein